MPLPCKVCESSYKETIEAMILNGESNNVIANDMQTKGLLISQASINRHKSKHMPEHQEIIQQIATPKYNTKHDRHDYMEINPIERLDKALKTKNNVRKFRQINDYVNQILVNQITIVLGLQERYMTGISKYPYEEIRGLHIINDILVKFELFIQSLPSILPINLSEKSLYQKVIDINDSMVNGKISIENANKLLNGLSISAKIFEIDELEKRIVVLESKNK